MEYEKMLDRLYLSLPEQTLNRERFEMPKPDSFMEGVKTIVRNYGALLKIIRKDEKHLLKFITKETATSANVDEGGRLILNGKFSGEQVSKLFHDYIKTFVLCPECGKPDTKTVEMSGIKMLQCEACGAMSAVKGL